MNKDQKQLLITQLDKKLASFSEARKERLPGEGWLHAIRTSLGMTMKQLGLRLDITPQAIKDIERREKDGSITMQRLKEIAAALDLQLVYALVPKNGTLERMIEERAYEKAKEIVIKTAHSMKLENQGLKGSSIEAAIESRAQKLKNELPKNLWN